MRAISYLLYLCCLPSCLLSYIRYRWVLEKLARTMATPEVPVQVDVLAYISKLSWMSVEQLYIILHTQGGRNVWQERDWIRSRIRGQSIYIRKSK